MRSIKENLSNEIIINKSKFICELIKIKDSGKVLEELNNIKNKYKDATHYCYAYIIDDKRKSSDDGEPGGTAGVPIMDTLNKADLNYVLCIVIRYFGGIKLGAGGLVRAYRKAVNDCLLKCNFYQLINGYELLVEVPYDKQKDIEHLIKYHYKKDFKENVIYTIECSKDIKEQIEKSYNIISREEKIIEI